MKWVVSKEDGRSELVDAPDYATAVANTPGGQSARIAQYIDKRRFGLVEEEAQKPEQDTPPYNDV